MIPLFILFIHRSLYITSAIRAYSLCVFYHPTIHVFLAAELFKYTPKLFLLSTVPRQRSFCWVMIRNPHSYGPLPVISTYNPIYRVYNSIYNQL